MLQTNEDMANAVSQRIELGVIDAIMAMQRSGISPTEGRIFLVEALAHSIGQLDITLDGFLAQVIAKLADGQFKTRGKL